MIRLFRKLFVVLILTIASVSIARAQQDTNSAPLVVADNQSMAEEATRIFTTHSSMEALVTKLKALKSSTYPVDKCEWEATDKIQVIEISKIEVTNGSQRKFFANRLFSCQNQKVSASLSAIITLRQEVSEETTTLSLEGLDGLDLNVDDLVHNF